jgi:hypothetical protein
MNIETDDEVYRVNAVWLGPPKATMPWHVRYVAWGIGIVVFFLVLAAERAVGIGVGIFSTAWALIITVIITRWVAHRIDHERPLASVLALVSHELRTPRERTSTTGGLLSAQRPVPVRNPGGRVGQGVDQLKGSE